jgi:aminoglycoside N3'-acetyltransferase
MEKNDAFVLMIGARWQMCSFFHRAEWLARVPYRYEKSFSGKIQLEGKTESLQETLFVRQLVPLVLTEWNGVNELFKQNGMKSVHFGPGEISGFPATKIMSRLVPLLNHDPYRFVKSPEEVSAAVSEVKP